MVPFAVCKNKTSVFCLFVFQTPTPVCHIPSFVFRLPARCLFAFWKFGSRNLSFVFCLLLSSCIYRLSYSIFCLRLLLLYQILVISHSRDLHWNASCWAWTDWTW